MTQLSILLSVISLFIFQAGNLPPRGGIVSKAGQFRVREGETVEFPCKTVNQGIVSQLDSGCKDSWIDKQMDRQKDMHRENDRDKLNNMDKAHTYRQMQTYKHNKRT